MIRTGESEFRAAPPAPPTITGDAVDTARFLAWRERLLRELRAANIAVKFAVLLPLFLPSVALWSSLYWFSRFDRTPWYDPSHLMFAFLVVFLMHYHSFLRGLTKLSKRHKKMKLIDIDWSKPKYQELAVAVIESGIDVTAITGKVTIDDSWDIHTYPQARELPSYYEKMVGRWSLLAPLSLMFLAYVGAKRLAIILVIAFGITFVTLVMIYTAKAILDLFRPRFTLAVSTRVLTYLKGNPHRFRLLVAHELSHMKHKDPVRRVVWESRSDTGGFFLGWGAIIAILVNVLGESTAPAWAFIVCLLGCCILHIIVSDLIPLIQELRADLEAVNSASDREALLQLLRVIPIESKHEPYLNRRISLRQIVSVVWDVKRLIRINEEKDTVGQRVTMLETGEVSFIRWLRLTVLAYCAVMILTVAAWQIYMWRLAIGS
jgi:hypothetical protein